MRAHYFQHVPFEGLGSIEPWLQANGYEITKTPFYQSWELPDLNQIQLLIVMGGPMSVNDGLQYPWISEEKKFVRDAIESGIPVLGICLGAQLIASAMGADVYQNHEKEIGWFPVHWISSGHDSPFNFPVSTEVFHWHGETFDLPVGANHLAKSQGCQNQAFQLGESVIGLQFHLETTQASAADLVENCRDELVSAKYVQTETTILSAPPEKYHRINEMMVVILKCLTQGQ